MTDWDPRDNMTLWQYIRFKLRLWAEIDRPPDWVRGAHDGYYDGYIAKYGQRPVDEEKTYTGDSLQYKIYYRWAGSPGAPIPEYYARIKR